jgi:hypothetical protein
MIFRRDGVAFEPRGAYLHIYIYTYDAGPAHLSYQDLALLGLAATPTGPRPASGVKRWREAVARIIDEIPRRPLPVGPGLTAGDLRLVAAEEGLDVFVLDYHAPPVDVSLAALARLIAA